MSSERRTWVIRSYKILRKAQRHFHPVLLGLLGVLTIAAGFIGFLPVLGFWMIPLGLMMVASAIPFLRRRLMRRLYRMRRKPAEPASPQS